MKFVTLGLIPLLTVCAVLLGMSIAKPQVDADEFPPATLEQMNGTYVSGAVLREVVVNNPELTYVVYTDNTLEKGEYAFVTGKNIWYDAEVIDGVTVVKKEAIDKALVKNEDDIRVFNGDIAGEVADGEIVLNTSDKEGLNYVKLAGKYACYVIVDEMNEVIGFIFELKTK